MHIPRGCAKAILTGEHAVVYGHEALAVALPLGFAATLDHPLDGPLLGVEVGGRRAAAGDGSPIGEALAAIAAALGVVRKRPLMVRVVGDVPPGRGLGSSAALCAVVADALGVAGDLGLTRADVARAARAGDDVLHGGRSSGVDAEAAARCELGLYTRAAGWRTVKAAQPLPLLIIDSGQARATAEVVARVAARREANPARVEALMAGMGLLARPAAVAAEAGNLPALGRLLDHNQFLLAELGVSTPGLDALCAEARAAGALGAKLTGAGGGGALVALMPSPAALATARPRFANAWEALVP